MLEYLRDTLTTSSYDTISNPSYTALCLARYFSRDCFFLRPNIEQLTINPKKKYKKKPKAKFSRYLLKPKIDLTMNSNSNYWLFFILVSRRMNFTVVLRRMVFSFASRQNFEIKKSSILISAKEIRWKMATYSNLGCKEKNGQF